MKTLSGLDGSFLSLETPETPMHVGSLHLFDLPEGYRRDFYSDVRHLIHDSLDIAPLYRRRLAEMPFHFANPVWADGGTVDLDYHVRRVRLPRPGSFAQLERAVARIHAAQMDRRRPLWEVHVFEGMKGGQTAFYMKVHHAVLDGAAGVALARALFGLPSQEPKKPAAKRAALSMAERPGIVGLAGAALRHDAALYVKLVPHIPDVFRLLAGMVGATGAAGGGPPGSLRQNFSFGPKTPLNVAITAERGFAGISIPLDEAKRIAASQEAKLNDVVLALCSGALRRYLAHRGGIPKKPLIATMPISLREAGNTDFNTQATLSLVSLCTNIADPLRRLRAIRDASGAVKSAARRARSVIPTDFPSIGVPWLLGGLAELYGKSRLASAIPPIANLVISNVPGPPVTLHAAGLPMRAYWPLSIVEHGLGVNITVMSYAGSLDFGIVAARKALPEPRKLAQALLEAHAELLQRIETPPVTKKKPAVNPKKAATRT
jgi:WS/DGAT/MGAT family acyltransferase